MNKFNDFLNFNLQMQQKMSDIQHELQFLSENYQRLDSNDSELNRKKQLIAIKSDKLKKEFGDILTKFQVKQNLSSHTIPSDDVKYYKIS
jgi:uncharacterized protein YabN with tetrapyrrole methylase and pyrophosphatase domain